MSRVEVLFKLDDVSVLRIQLNAFAKDEWSEKKIPLDICLNTQGNYVIGTRSGYHLLGVKLINISINFFHIKKLPPKLPPFLFGTQRAWVSCFGQVVVIHMPPRPDTGQKYFLGVQLNGVYGSTSF